MDWAWGRPQLGLQDDARGIRCLRIMHAKFGRSSDAPQINFIRTEHTCWRLSERGGWREGIRDRKPEALCFAKH